MQYERSWLSSGGTAVHRPVPVILESAMNVCLRVLIDRADEVASRTPHECGQARQEVEGLGQELGGAAAKAALERVHHEAVAARLRWSGVRNVAAQRR